MKIAHIILGKANPERMNGINKVVYELANAEHKAGHEVWIYGITGNPVHDYPERPYPTLLFGKFLFHFFAGKRFIHAVEKITPDTLVHLHGGFVPEYYTIVKLLKERNIRYIITPHGNYMEGALHKNGFVKKLYFRFIESFILKNAHAIHCLGEGEKKNLKKIFKDNTNIVVIPNGTNTDTDYHHNTSNPVCIFGYCGRLTRYQKGLDILLEGYKLFNDRYPGNSELWIIGDGEYFSTMNETIKKYQLEGKVKLFGKKFGQEKQELLDKMHAFFHPSRHEGMPMALLEAAASGIPLVVSEYTNMSGYVEEYKAGISLKNNSADEVAEAMHEISLSKESGNINILSMNAYEMSKKAFSWNTIVKKIETIFNHDATKIHTAA